jgi:hypothetical protein
MSELQPARIPTLLDWLQTTLSSEKDSRAQKKIIYLRTSYEYFHDALADGSDPTPEGYLGVRSSCSTVESV